MTPLLGDDANSLPQLTLWRKGNFLTGDSNSDFCHSLPEFAQSENLWYNSLREKQKETVRLGGDCRRLLHGVRGDLLWADALPLLRRPGRMRRTVPCVLRGSAGWAVGRRIVRPYLIWRTLFLDRQCGHEGCPWGCLPLCPRLDKTPVRLSTLHATAFCSARECAAVQTDGFRHLPCTQDTPSVVRDAFCVCRMLSRLIALGIFHTLII